MWCETGAMNQLFLADETKQPLLDTIYKEYICLIIQFLTPAPYPIQKN